ncbi:DUF421 domain-containing protein [Tellurirhabdus bombi]|uniref:DUF421 domain-containing protein n=1 Tax=Tellurirhabdus bombi TaxID=2907205 RepID=UPI001F3AE2A0|nr:YetF domain-containing protein [Tellurirhabdus bombi]
MKKEEIHLVDWYRILVGNVPGSFYIEILIRVSVVYLILVVSMRLMGRRMASKLSRNEMAAMVSMAAAIGVPILDTQRGLLPVIIIACVIVVSQQLISRRAAKDESFEGVSQGIITILIENAVLKLDKMREVGISRELLFAQLRSEGIAHLGYVKRLYLEANGAFTLIEEKEPKPGLSILPFWDTEYIAEQEQVDDQLACSYCGQPHPSMNNKETPCPTCRRTEWVAPIK